MGWIWGEYGVDEWGQLDHMANEHEWDNYSFNPASITHTSRRPPASL